MKPWLLTCGLFLGLVSFAAAQQASSNTQDSSSSTTTTTTTTNSDQAAPATTPADQNNAGAQDNNATTTHHTHKKSSALSNSHVPKGTKAESRETTTVVKPIPNKVKINSGTIKSAQKALNDRGYDVGTADGVAGPKTTAALRKFQGDNDLPKTGHFDTATLTKLNVGGTNMVGAAPADLGRGGKAFGHDIKAGHPIDASKALGEGAASFGKKVGKGTKALAVGGVDKAAKGTEHIGSKVSNKTEGNNSNDNNPK